VTTQAAAALYLAQHRYETEGRRWAVFNPHDKPLVELPVIYGFNNGGSPGWFSAVALSQDGKCLGSHCCSAEGYMEHDLGILEGCREDRHEKDYRPHYPEGYRMEFVGFDDINGHEGLIAAIKLANERPAENGAENGDADV
jgi:hypothetical protein